MDKPLEGDAAAPASFTFYAIRNHQGKWGRSKGRSYVTKTWVDDLGEAKIYSDIGKARARVTWLANADRKAPIPDIVEFHATTVKVVDQKDRVAESRRKKALEEKQRQEWLAKARLEDAQRRLAAAQAEIKKYSR